jgi:hypothetical protein
MVVQATKRTLCGPVMTAQRHSACNKILREFEVDRLQNGASARARGSNNPLRGPTDFITVIPGFCFRKLSLHALMQHRPASLFLLFRLGRRRSFFRFDFGNRESFHRLRSSGVDLIRFGVVSAAFFGRNNCFPTFLVYYSFGTS